MEGGPERRSAQRFFYAERAINAAGDRRIRAGDIGAIIGALILELERTAVHQVVADVEPAAPRDLEPAEHLPGAAIGRADRTAAFAARQPGCNCWRGPGGDRGERDDPEVLVVLRTKQTGTELLESESARRAIGDSV
ncbi:hypothetical protein D3C71_1295050 [compost metagenome]